MKKVKTLKLNYEFKNVFNRGKYFRAHQVIGYVLINKFGYNRLGLAISTKLCKAVGRNRIKRVIRAAYLDLIREYNLKQGQIIELVRMALNGKQETTSQVLAKAIKKVKQDVPLCKMIVSYADIDQSHKGIIYQATNWYFVGKRLENKTKVISRS